MPDFSKGKIYSLRSFQTDAIYIGSTIQSLAKRKGAHISAFKNWLNGGKGNFVTSFTLCEYDDMYIELIEECPCNNKSELLRQEGKIIRETDCVNRCIAGRTLKEYRDEHKDQIKLRDRKYYEKHNEIKKLYSAEYREANKETINSKVMCDCGSYVNKHGLNRHKKTHKHILLMSKHQEPEEPAVEPEI
jgi:hypothetical protein